MKCPRCHTEISIEDSHCSDCKLPKPKNIQAQNEGAEQKTEAARKKAPHRASRNARKQVKHKQRPKWVDALAGGVAVLLLCGVGLYLTLFFSSMPEELDPKAALPMLERLRNSPSSRDGLNVDALLSQELEKSRRVGNLLSFQGWTIRPVNGSKTKLVISFSFEEKDNTQQRAEWIADLVRNTYTPQTDLAASVYSKQ
ncbi:MAG TPA: hypothetical protein VNI02_14175 [Blastocatellia bacterium]|jgi:hypothetical protein|nr:hypothetical protein [Blastocatellia bacterium]